jgi:hypothetical protein
MSLILVFIIYMIFYAITLCFIMFLCPFVGPLIWTNTILSYHYLEIFGIFRGILNFINKGLKDLRTFAMLIFFSIFIISSFIDKISDFS